MLADVVTASESSGVVVAGIVHADLMTLQPFASGNDLVARAASRVVLVARGADPDALTVPEMGLLELGADAYEEALDAFAGGTPTGLAHWLTFHAASVQRGAAFARTLCR
jgi:Fic family protein